MGIASVSIEMIQQSARRAAEQQARTLVAMRWDVSRLEVRRLERSAQPAEIGGVVASDAGLVSVMLAPFHLELLHVADHRGRVHLTEFFPLTTLAADLREIFERNPVLQRFVERLGCKWDDLSDLWETSTRSQLPMPRDVRLVADTLREIAEWAVLMDLACEADDPLSGNAAAQRNGPVRRVILHDGMLRSITLRDEIISTRLPAWWQNCAWREQGVMIAGVGKSSMVWQRLALSLSLDSRVRGVEHCYIPIPLELEAALARRPTGRRLGFGQLVLLKTRSDEMGQLLPVDIPFWIMQEREIVESVLAALLEASRATFPMPGYPAPLEAAHEASHLSDFDSKIVRDLLIQALGSQVSSAEMERMLRFWAFQRDKWPKTGRFGRD
ncbi:MAG: hypothetical protein N2049_03600 [Anaerolineales bacterium]|nr:hypothetical protein [Anaerolineales bacterium]